MQFFKGFLLSIGVMAGCASAFAPSTASLALRQSSRSASACSPVMLSSGEQFPADVAAQLGIKGKSAVVYFYPSDGSPGCTKEATAFNAALPEFKKLNVEVVGVRSEKTAKADFEEQYSQRMVKDTNDEMRKKLGIKNDLFGVLPGRETFVVGKDGKVELVFNNQLKPEQHVEEALKAAQSLSASAPSGFSLPKISLPF
eukprot:CAMPEP_0196719698 /NCGR_PEP_ID=MMETSP1091-20130531/2641_1 /TAXON_ID=302021 /ORGANISM="Rhodomonas sp., Strain CCMP768" /LENGTH=198 /DNA_ID=CAMNT_0042060727 /DNA_START=62 /DNA_END=658 /DNA_ORIENTATION=-